jgi:outer membrane protein assembly factor BamD (BamD/ComL family)
LREYEKTIAHFEKVIEKWPDYEYAWSAQHLIGTYVNLLMEAGKMPASEAEPRIEAAWQAMVDNYRGKPLYSHALRKLGGFYLEREQPQKAVGYFEVFCEEYPEDRWRAGILYDLAGAYEATGETALAADVYEEFIEDYPDDPQAAQAQAKLAELGGAD